MALMYTCKKVVGIELSATRHKHAIKAVQEAHNLVKKKVPCFLFRGPAATLHTSLLSQDAQDASSQNPSQFPNSSRSSHEYAHETVQHVQSGRLQILHGDIMKPTYNDATHLYAASTTWPDHLIHTVAEIAATQITSLKSFSTLRTIPTETLTKFPSIYLWKTIKIAVSWQDAAHMHIYRFHRGSDSKRKKSSSSTARAGCLGMYGAMDLQAQMACQPPAYSVAPRAPPYLYCLSAYIFQLTA